MGAGHVKGNRAATVGVVAPMAARTRDE